MDTALLAQFWRMLDNFKPPPPGSSAAGQAGR